LLGAKSRSVAGQRGVWSTRTGEFWRKLNEWQTGSKREKGEIPKKKSRAEKWGGILGKKMGPVVSEAELYVGDDDRGGDGQSEGRAEWNGEKGKNTTNEEDEKLSMHRGRQSSILPGITGHIGRKVHPNW